ncbi:MAG: GNAT family N-acetyltransferase [bacterium JZ-2024 1]
MAEISPLTREELPSVLMLLERCGVFFPHELAVAQEVFTAALEPSSGYEAFLARSDGQVIGVVCFGKNPMTDNVYDLYWIAVAPEFQRGGIGLNLIKFVQEEVRKRKGRKIVVETSSLPSYEPARRLYEKAGFCEAAVLRDFYAPSNHKVFYIWTVALPEEEISSFSEK